MNNKATTDNPFIRSFFGAAKGCLIGIIAGILFGALGGCIFWALFKIINDPLYSMSIDLIGFVGIDVVMTGVPLSFLIGTITGLHQSTFRTPDIKPLAWAALAYLGTSLGLWFSHLNYQFDTIVQVIYYIEVAFISFTTGWITRQYSTPKFGDQYRKFKLEAALISVIGGLSLIVAATYYYFHLLFLVRNVPS